MARQVALHIETTGCSSHSDDIIEIGAAELVDGKFTGKTLHSYIKPTHPSSDAAAAVHHIRHAKVSHSKPFGEIAKPFIEFIKGADLLIYFPQFDMKMLNAALAKCKKLSKHNTIEDFSNSVIDIHKIAQQAFPGDKHLRFADVCDTSHLNLKREEVAREPALRDARLYAEAYLKLKEKIETKLEIKAVCDQGMFKRPTDERVSSPSPKRVASM